MGIDLYYHPASTPCRAVMLTAKAVGVEFKNKKVINPMEGENMKPEYLKINPQHTIPTIVDDSFSLWESRAIMVYLATKYGKGDTLYPNDAKKRGVVEQRLFFDMGTLHQRFGDLYHPVMMGKRDTLDEEKVPKLNEAMEILDGFLSKTKWAADDHITIADHSLVASIGSMDAAGLDLTPYKNVTRWYKQCQKEMPGYKESNQDGIDMIREMTKKMKEGKKPY